MFFQVQEYKRLYFELLNTHKDCRISGHVRIVLFSLAELLNN